MGIIKTKGIILSESNMNDFDKMLTVLTPNGKIGCAAKGARKPKSLLMAGTQLFVFGEYMLYQGTSSYHINSCDTIELFYPIRTDLDKLKYAAHITKIINDVTDENQNTYRILQLFLNTLYMISETDKDLDFILSVFRLRLLCLLGFTPQIKACTNCKTGENITHFSIRDNGFKCEACSKVDKGALQLSDSTKTAIQYIVLADPKKIFSFQISEENLQELNLVSNLYFNEKLEKEYKVENLF
ncbi:MAG: DNA repair protein RecO [Clostridia bacterium]|jgi:DNA repair protein RecO (recombination protein O)|nr:DNA repair protein RecO [Clostridia bacterium]MCI9413228.1 DNA repair protein RecO [Clostridia bacterium]